MMKILFLLLALVSSGALAQAVSAGQEFKGGYVNVRVPNSDGWLLVRSSSGGIEFAKPTADGENLAAQILMFALPPMTTRDEFVALIKQSFAQDTDANRFDVLNVKTEYSPDRAYPCVRLSAAVRDNEAQTASAGGTTEAMLLEMEALYCRHPVRNDTGFAAIYSHRGRASHAALKTEAVDFINGIQVPRKQ